MLGPEDILVERPVRQAAKQQDAPVNLLAYNRPYDAVGRTSVICCEPAELHFRGFEPGQPMQQVLQLRNICGRQTRVVTVPPSSSCFKVVEQVNSGSLAPGLCQQLVVQFIGKELQHYQDTILVHTEDGGLLIPLHAYPSTGSPPLCKHLDLGHVPLGDTVSRQLPLTCSAGTAFDFSVNVLQHNKHFTVTPLSGSVPAYGSAAVTICFTPTQYSTEHLQLQVVLGEYGAKPMQVMVSGSCRPGLVQQKVVASALGSLPAIDTADGGYRATKQQLHDQTASSPKAHSKSPRRRAAGSTSLLPAALVSPQRITQHDVNMLLNQRPGKLQTKDIKAAITARKQELAVEQQLLQAALDAGVASGIDPLDQPEIQPDIKEALFQLQLSQAEASARHSTGLVSSKDGAHVGSVPPTAEQLASMKATRAAVLAEMEARRREAAVHRLHLELKPAGAVHVLPDPVGAGGCDSSSAQHQTAGSSSSSSGLCTSVGSSAATGCPGLEKFQPQWLLLSESNDWRKRVQVAQRFVQVARVVIYRNRAQARIKKLRGLAARLRGSKDGLAGQVLQDLVVGGSVVQRPGVAPSTLMVPDRVRATELPQFCPQAYAQHEAVDRGMYADFSALQPQPFKAEFEYTLLGYKAEEPPSLLPYVPLCLDQPLLLGAVEDMQGGLTVGLLPGCLASLATMDAMPEGLLSNPHTSCVAKSSTQFCLQAPAWGLEPEHMLQPKKYEHKDSGAEPPGLCTAKAAAASASNAKSGSTLKS